MKTLILGSPGCGKTTRLIRITLDEMKKGTVLYLTFSREAIKEVRERLNIKDSDVFSTSHAFCFKLLGLKRSQVLSPLDYKKIAYQAGLPSPSGLNRTKSQNSLTHHHIANQTTNMIDYINRKRMTMNVSIGKDCPFDRVKLRKLWLAMKDYKMKTGKYDFTDMIDEGCKLLRDASLPLQALIVDEAQDLAPLQWELVHLLSKQAQNVYVAGDDDQEIYSFVGADSKEMLELPNKGYRIEHLKQSYRLPKSVYNMSKKVIQHVKDRFEKVFHSRDEEGAVIFADSWSSITKKVFRNKTDKWLILSSSNAKVDRHKLLTQEDIKGKQRHMTIHQSKGKEEDNVILFTELSSRFRNSLTYERMIKLFYVGATRAKKRLVVIGHDEKGFVF